MQRAMSAGSAGSKVASRSPSSSGIAEVRAGCDGSAAGHRLEDREARALVQRGKDEQLAAPVERGQVPVRDEAGEQQVSRLDAEAAGEDPQAEAEMGGEVAGDDELVRVPHRGGQLGVAADRALEVLAVVDASDVEQVAGPDLGQRGAQDRVGLLASLDEGGEAVGDPRVDHGDPLLRHVEVLHRVVGGLLGDGEDLLGGAEQAEAGDPGRRHVAPVRVVALAHDQRDQVVEGDHQPRAAAPRSARSPPGRARPRTAT